MSTLKRRTFFCFEWNDIRTKEFPFQLARYFLNDSIISTNKKFGNDNFALSFKVMWLKGKILRLKIILVGRKIRLIDDFKKMHRINSNVKVSDVLTHASSFISLSE